VNTKSLESVMPFVWPEPRVSAGLRQYLSALPFDSAVRSATAVFGVVSAVDTRAVKWLKGLLDALPDLKLRLVVSIHPTCRTTEADLVALLHLVERHGERAGFKVFPERSLVDRSSNLLCLLGADGSLAISTGPTENLGYVNAAASQANVVMRVTAGPFEAYRKWFEYLWGLAGPLRPELVASMPRLVLPEGDIEASRLWAAFREQCLAAEIAGREPPSVRVDPDSGEVTLVDEHGDALTSPTDEIGVPKLDGLAEAVARVFELGQLVSIDKSSRIPPLEAPVKPEWFGVKSFRQTGTVRAQTSIKVAPFDEKTLKKIDRLRRVSSELLPRYSFPLADGIRWIPREAIPLFEAAMTAANEEAKRLLKNALGESVDDFLDSQSSRIRRDADRMYKVYHPLDQIPDGASSNILHELRARLDKTRGDKIIPRVAYSPIAFAPNQSDGWSSPWGQAFTLLKGIAEFPRLAMTDQFFWRGIKTDQAALIKAMDVAGDCIVKAYGTPEASETAEIDLHLIRDLEGAPCSAQDKCRALWRLITTGDDQAVGLLIAAGRARPH
jgi:hypothetical protein